MSESSHIFWLSRVQAPLQTFLRPGIWIPGARTPHYYRETWIIEDSPENTYQDIIQAIESVQLRKKWQIRKTDEEQLFIQVLAFTPYCNWLDILEIQFDTSLTQSATTVHVKCFSSGVLPAVIPLSFVWNIMFCWAPFWDKGLNENRVMTIRDAMSLAVNVETRGRPC